MNLARRYRRLEADLTNLELGPSTMYWEMCVLLKQGFRKVRNSTDAR
jgi:hypothetical protein